MKCLNMICISLLFINVLISGLISPSEAEDNINVLELTISMESPNLITNEPNFSGTAPSIVGLLTIKTPLNLTGFVNINLSIIECPFFTVVAPDQLEFELPVSRSIEFIVTVVVPWNQSSSIEKCVIKAVAVQGENITSAQTQFDIIIPQYYIVNAGASDPYLHVEKGTWGAGQFLIYNDGNGMDKFDIKAEIANNSIIDDIQFNNRISIPGGEGSIVHFKCRIKDDVSVFNEEVSTITFDIYSCGANNVGLNVSTALSFTIIHPGIIERISVSYILILIAFLVASFFIIKSRKRLRNDGKK